MTIKSIKIRPQFLTFLCIGSAAFGFLWIIMFLTLIVYSSFNKNVPSALFPGIVIEYLHAGYAFVIAEIVLTAIGLTGVFLMWRLKKGGFYLYAVIKALTYFLPVIYIGSHHLTFPGLFITSIFIIMYGVSFSTNLKNDRKSK